MQEIQTKIALGLPEIPLDRMVSNIETEKSVEAVSPEKELPTSTKEEKVVSKAGLTDEQKEYLKPKMPSLPKAFTSEQDDKTTEEKEVIASEDKQVEAKKAEEKPLSIFAKLKAEYSIEDEYEETEQGLEKLLQDIPSSPKVREAIVSQFLEDNPIYSSLKEHIERGHGLGSFVDMIQAVDYGKISKEISEDTTDLNKQLYIDSMKLKGLDDEDIALNIELAEQKDEEFLLQRAQKAIKELDANQRNLIIAKQEKESQQKADYEKQVEQEWIEVKSVISKGKILEAELDAAEIKALTDFVSKPTKNGKTQRDISIESETLEQQLFIDNIRRNGYKLPTVETKKSAPKKEGAVSLKDLISQNNTREKVDLSGGSSANNSEKILSLSEAKKLFGK